MDGTLRSATALHNVQQQKMISRPLALQEDPLAYLGILVDCLQEWDRYTAFRQQVIGGAIPIQGVDVKSGADPDGKIAVEYGNPDRVRTLREILDRSLHDWTRIRSE